ncbi:hypothetical protein D3C81_1796130 [compost metagenome]
MQVEIIFIVAQMPDDGFARYHSTFGISQQRQEQPFRLRKPYISAGTRGNAPLVGNQAPFRRLRLPWWLHGRCSCSAHDAAYRRSEHLYSDGLGKIGIRALVQPADMVVCTASSREHDDPRLAQLAQVLRHREATLVR